MPLIILQLGLVAGADGAMIAATIGADSESHIYPLCRHSLQITPCLTETPLAHLSPPSPLRSPSRGNVIATPYSNLPSLTLPAHTAVLSVISLYLASVSVVTTVKWFWFVIAAILLVCVVAAFARGFKESANLRGPDVASLYGQLAALVMICFIFYPVRPACWLLVCSLPLTEASEGLPCFLSASIQRGSSLLARLRHTKRPLLRMLKQHPDGDARQLAPLRQSRPPDTSVCGQMVWLFSEGFASFSVSFEVCAYAMLDIVSKVIFCFIVMAGNDALVR